MQMTLLGKLPSDPLLKLKGKFSKIVIRLALLYGTKIVDNRASTYAKYEHTKEEDILMDEQSYKKR